MIRGYSIWTFENLEKLKKLRDKGLSARQIAEELGNRVTRNAVIGKLNRMNLRLRSTKNAHVSSIREGLGTFRRRRRSINGRPRTYALNRFGASYPLPIAEQIPSTAVGFLDLENHHCRYPYGEGSNIKFCGEKKSKGSYCETHHSKCCNTVRV